MRYEYWSDRKREILNRMDALYHEIVIAEDKDAVRKELNALSQEFQSISAGILEETEVSIYDKVNKTSTWIGETTKHNKD